MRTTTITKTIPANLRICNVQTRFSTERPGEFQNPMIAPFFMRHELADELHPVRLTAELVLGFGLGCGSWASSVGASV